MSIFPQTFKEYNQWAENIAFELKSSSNGQLRIGANKLSAIMAATLPAGNKSFNINTMKSYLDSLSNNKKSLNIPKEKDNNEDQLLFGFKTHFAAFSNNFILDIWETLKSSDNTYDKIHDNYLGIYSSPYILNDNELAIVSSVLPAIDKDRVNEAYSEVMNELEEEDYITINRVVMSRSYSLYLLDTIYCFFQLMDSYYQENKKFIDNLKFNDFSIWYQLTISLWNGDSNDSKCFEKAFELLPKFEPANYDVIVRATISGTISFLEDYEIPEKWNDYDYTEDDGDATLKLSTTVSVKAISEEKAIEQAKLYAPDLGISGEALVELWVDSDEDGEITKY